MFSPQYPFTKSKGFLSLHGDTICEIDEECGDELNFLGPSGCSTRNVVLESHKQTYHIGQG